MARKKINRMVAASASNVASSGPDRKVADCYPVLFNPLAKSARLTEVNVRPVARFYLDGSHPYTGNIKVKPDFKIKDAQGSPVTLIGSQVLTVREKSIRTDEKGDYASFQLCANHGNPQTAGVFNSAQGVVPISVGLEIDLGRRTAYYEAETKIKLLVNDWSLAFKKPAGCWCEIKDLKLASLPEADSEALAQIARCGGIIDVIIDGGVKINDGVTLWNESAFAGAEVELTKAGDVRPCSSNYLASEGVYRTEIPGELGPARGPKTVVRIEAWLDDTLHNRFSKLAAKARELQDWIGGKMVADAEAFTQACLDNLARKTPHDLETEARAFKQATYAAVFFLEYTLETAKAFRLVLNLHNSVYERYMQNLVAVAMEVVFFFGTEFFEKVFGKVIKNGAGAAEATLKAEARTLAHEAVESAERALVPKMDAVKALTAEARATRQTAAGAMRTAISESEKLTAELAASELKKQEKAAAKEAVDSSIDSLSREVSALRVPGVPADLPGVNAALESVAGELQRNSDELAAAMKLADSIRDSLSHSPAAGGQMVDAMEAALKHAEKQVADLQKVANGLSSREGVLQQMSSAVGRLNNKTAEADDLARQLLSIEQSITRCNDLLPRQRAAVNDELNRFVDAIKKQTDGETEIAALTAQQTALATLKAEGHGGEKEFREALKKVMEKMPPGDDMRMDVLRRVSADAKADEIMASLRALEQSEAVMLASASEGQRQAIAQEMAALRATMKRLEKAEATSEAIFQQYIGWSADYIKGKFNERAQQIRTLLESLTHSDYKAVPAKYYDDTLWGQACALTDSVLQGAAEWWNWFCSFIPSIVRWTEEASESKDWGPWLLGNTLSFLAKFSFALITLVVLIVDRLLQLLMKLLEGILYIANSPSFAASALTEKAKSDVVHPPRGMPAALPVEFFAFSKELVSNVAHAVNPKELADKKGGKEVVAAGIKEKFGHAYQEYYEPQWDRACLFMRELCGSSAALDPRWIESAEVNAERREAAGVLQAVLGPMEKFQAAFDKKRGDALTTDLITLGSDFWSGDWTLEDLDVLFEKIGDAMSLAIKFTGAGLLAGGALFGCVPAVAAGAAVMAAGGVTDAFSAAMRTLTTALGVMPSVLGAQFDVMRAYSLAYMEIYQGYDLSTVIKSKQ